MILLDAYALIAFVRGEGAAPPVAGLLRSGEAAIPSINLAEVIDQLVRRFGVPYEAVREVVDGLTAQGLSVLHTDDATPWAAARLRARHYQRRSRPLSLADCVLLAFAGSSDAIATADRPVIATATDEGIDVVPLPDSRGRNS